MLPAATRCQRCCLACHPAPRHVYMAPVHGIFADICRRRHLSLATCLLSSSSMPRADSGSAACQQSRASRKLLELEWKSVCRLALGVCRETPHGQKSAGRNDPLPAGLLQHRRHVSVALEIIQSFTRAADSGTLPYSNMSCALQLCTVAVHCSRALWLCTVAVTACRMGC